MEEFQVTNYIYQLNSLYIVVHSFPSYWWLKRLIKCPHVYDVFNQPRWRCLNLLFFTKWMQIGLAGAFQKLHFPHFPESVVRERESNFLTISDSTWCEFAVFHKQHGMFRLLKIYDNLGVSTCFRPRIFPTNPPPKSCLTWAALHVVSLLKALLIISEKACLLRRSWTSSPVEESVYETHGWIVEWLFKFFAGPSCICHMFVY